MALISHSSYESGISSKKDIMKIEKDIWCNDEGICKESDGGLPKGWRKGKLIAKKGWEMSEAEYKALNFEKKAKAPKENKSK